MKKQLMNRLLLLFVIFASVSAYSQSNLAANELTQEWSLVNNESGVNIYARQDFCKVGPQVKLLTYIFYKIENTNSIAKNIYFVGGLKYYQECIGCNGEEESRKAINVPANSSIECDCTFTNGILSSLITNPNYPDTRRFESVHILDIKID
ncbi:MAG: hypothetical protein QNK85_09165 [Crocinitomicaceae bacterium]